MKKAFIVQNPVAGTHSADTVRHKIEQHFNDIDWDYQIYQTTGEENIGEIVQQACQKGCDMVVAAGGDGTVSAVASGLVGQQQPLGILPVGTGNGLAHDLRIPLKLEDALALLDGEHAILPIDAIKMQNHFFLLNLSVGLTPKIIQQSTREKKRHMGRMAYILETIRAFFGIQPITFFLKIDGQPHTLKASELLLMNSVTIGKSAQYLNLGIENHDGRLDLFIIKTNHVIDYLRILWNIVFHRPKRDPKVDRFSVKDSLEIKTKFNRIIQADGELIGTTPQTVHLIPAAIQLVQPADSP